MSTPWLVGIEESELIALRLEPFDGLGQGGLEFVDALEGVVKGDDGAVAGVALHVVDDFVGGEEAAVVTGDDVPHDDGELAAQAHVLCPAHPAPWGAEQLGVDELVGLVGVAQEGLAAVAEPSDVVEGVVAEPVSASGYLVHEFGVLTHVVAHHEERGLHPVAV